ncbi:putative disease resistance protein RGA3 [Hordeum vulgare]|nr:putative disease resistance protein RGA3 [Hordeum vulgare]
MSESRENLGKQDAGGSWDLKGHVVILAEYDGFTNPEKVKLDKLETWHKLPDGVLKSERALGNLAQRIGEVQVTLPNGFAGEFIRVRVKLDVNKKLTRVVGITKGGETEKYLVKFEKLPTFCHACGLMGHWYEKCGRGEHDVTKFEWGNFLLTPRRGRGGGHGGHSNGGRGRDSRSFGPSNGRGEGDDEDDWAGAFGRGTGRGNLSLDETKMQVVVAMDTNVLGKRYVEDSGATANRSNEGLPQVGAGAIVPTGNTANKVDKFDAGNNGSIELMGTP